MKTKEEIQKALSISNRTYCKACKSVLYSVFDRLYIQEFGRCYECDFAKKPHPELEVRVQIITNMLEKL